jgi:hypothetical protein
MQFTRSLFRNIRCINNDRDYLHSYTLALVETRVLTLLRCSSSANQRVVRSHCIPADQGKTFCVTSLCCFLAPLATVLVSSARRSASCARSIAFSSLLLAYLCAISTHLQLERVGSRGWTAGCRPTRFRVGYSVVPKVGTSTWLIKIYPRSTYGTRDSIGGQVRYKGTLSQVEHRGIDLQPTTNIILHQVDNLLDHMSHVIFVCLEKQPEGP